MYMIEIAALDNGAHKNQTFHGTLPAGWAIIPDGFTLPATFPFVDVEVSDGIVTKLTEREMPEPSPLPEPEIALESLAAENTKLKAQLKLQSEQQTFLEDCLLEMADVVYA
jgi:hypothetical protein